VQLVYLQPKIALRDLALLDRDMVIDLGKRIKDSLFHDREAVVTGLCDRRVKR
jgi:hypothetical protein